MSGTELGRLMDEVTAQPPVDVDFGTVVQLVERRRSRARKAAASAGVLAVAVVIAVPTIWGPSPHTAGQSIPPAPTAPVVMPPTTWQSAGLTWTMPSGWATAPQPVAPAYDHTVLLLKGPFFGNTVFNSGCGAVTTGITCERGRLVGMLPADGVLAQITVSTSDNIEGDAGQFGPVDIDGQTSAPDSVCRSLGGDSSYTWSHLFGPRSAGSLVQVWGCLGADAATTGKQQLTTLAATIRDAGYPDLKAGTCCPTQLHEKPGLVSASSGPFRWRMPATWRLGLAPAAVPGLLTAPRYLGPATFADPCTLDPGSCAAPSLKVAPAGVLTSITYGPIGATATPAPSVGSIVTNDGDCIRRGVAKAFVAERDFGTVAHGVRLGFAACLGDGYTGATLSTLKSIVASFTDVDLPPMAAPTVPTAIATGTTAAALCKSALGSYATAELATVGDIRTATWGPPLPNDKGRLADAFPGAPASDKAAWCWVRTGRTDADFAVHAGSVAVPAISIGYTGRPIGAAPSGPPEVS